MVLEISLQCAENTHFFWQTHNPERMQDEHSLDQSSKFTSYNFLVTMDLKSKFNLRIVQTEHPGY